MEFVPMCKICNPPRRHRFADPHEFSGAPITEKKSVLAQVMAAVTGKSARPASSKRAQPAPTQDNEFTPAKIKATRSQTLDAHYHSKAHTATFGTPPLTEDGAPGPKTPFDKTAYQREYMRKRRQAAKS